MHINTKNSHNKEIIIAGFAGIVAGAAGVTALVLTDKDLREKVEKKAKNLHSSVQNWSTEKLQMIDIHTNKAIDGVQYTEKLVGQTKKDDPLKEASMKN